VRGFIRASQGGGAPKRLTALLLSPSIPGIIGNDLPFTMLPPCAWRDAPAGPAPVVAGLRQFFCGWFGIGRVVVGMDLPKL
jgi:hypothetical protein